MAIEFLEGCQNPWGCRRLAIKTVEVAGKEVELCAYCTDEVRNDG